MHLRSLHATSARAAHRSCAALLRTAAFKRRGRLHLAHRPHARQQLAHALPPAAAPEHQRHRHARACKNDRRRQGPCARVSLGGPHSASRTCVLARQDTPDLRGPADLLSPGRTPAPARPPPGSASRARRAPTPAPRNTGLRGQGGAQPNHVQENCRLGWAIPARAPSAAHGTASGTAAKHSAWLNARIPRSLTKQGPRSGARSHPLPRQQPQQHDGRNSSHSWRQHGRPGPAHVVHCCCCG